MSADHAVPDDTQTKTRPSKPKATTPAERGPRDDARIDAVRQALGRVGLDALVCALPKNVLLLSGYWPVVGTAVVVAARDGRVGLAVPADEMTLAKEAWADVVEPFTPGSLEAIQRAGDVVRAPLLIICRRLGVVGGHIGYDGGEAMQEASYAALHLYGARLGTLLSDVLPEATVEPAEARLAELRSCLTVREGNAVAAACRLAQGMFRRAHRQIRVGRNETTIAASLRASLAAEAQGPARTDGFVYCMAGTHSALAGGAYARSRADVTVARGDLVLIHCNSYLDGFWTDITRTYCVGRPTRRVRAMFEAVFEAREAALAALRPGVRAAAVDTAARAVLERRGFGSGFTHSTGHGVGFAAIDHDAIPRLHPASHDVLAPGMVFNVEPAIYDDALGGIRHCDVVQLDDSGPRVLTSFQATLDKLIVEPRA